MNKLSMIRSAFTVVLLLAAIYAHGAGFDYRYKARIGDLNGDGLSDVYLQHNPKLAFVSLDDISAPIPVSKTALKRFVLLREPAGSFTLMTSLSASQRSQVASWPAKNLGFSNGDYNGDGEVDLFVGSIPSASDPFDFREVVILAPSASTSMQAVDGLLGHTYYVRAGDINNDGAVDLFVTGNSLRFVPNFILQRASGGFSVISNPTGTQTAQASAWPIAKGVSVLREDINFDGYYDFFLEGLTSLNSAYDDAAIVFTRRGIGSEPVKVVPINQHFQDIAAEIGSYLQYGKPLLDLFYTEVCIQQYAPMLPLPTYQWDWLFNPAPDSWYRAEFEFWFGQILQNYTNGFANQQQTCYVAGGTKPREIQQFVRSAGDYIGLGAVACIECVIRAQQILTQAEGWLVSAATVAAAARIARGAWTMTAVLVGDDATGIGTVDDVLLPVVILVGAAAEVVLVIAENAGHQDAGNQSTPAPISNGGYAEPPGYDPNDPNQNKAWPNNTSSSERLARNMQRTGNRKPSADAEAHHIVRKDVGAPGNEHPVVRSLHDLLKRHGIDIDEAVNGVWLPRSQSAANQAGTKALPHRTLHTDYYHSRVLSRLESAESVGGGDAVRLELRHIAQALQNGLLP